MAGDRGADWDWGRFGEWLGSLSPFWYAMSALLAAVLAAAMVVLALAAVFL